MCRRADWLRRSLSLLLLAASSASCYFTTWKTRQEAPEQVLEQNRPDHVRIVTSTGATLELWNPGISGDSVVGSVSKPTRGEAGQAGGVPLSDVRKLETRGTNTGVVVAAAGATLLFVAALIAYANTDLFDTDNSGSDQTYSCPLVYSWDGQRWRLDSGTFGGAIMPALARTEVDNLLYAVPVGDSLRLRVTNELNETDHLDRLAVLAVDHPAGRTVAPDATGQLHSLGSLVPPTRARDFRGRDALARVAVEDGWAWESNPVGRDSSRAAHVRDGLDLQFPRPPGVDNARLVIDVSNTAWAEYMMGRYVGLHGSAAQGWYDSVAAYPALAVQIRRMMEREIHLGVWVHANGRWQRRGSVIEAGPEVWKRQVVPLDLSGVTGGTVRVRLESAPSLWLIDRVALDGSSAQALTIRELAPASATPLRGHPTLPLIATADRGELVLERGDAVEVAFAVPSVPPGLMRSYLLLSHGWYRLHLPAAGPPQTAVLDRALRQPLAASRIVTGELARAVNLLGTR
jgi:hypothetical protein